MNSTEVENRTPGPKEDALQFRKVKLISSPHLLSLNFCPGIHAIISPTDELSRRFIACSIGSETPLRGKIILGNKRPGHCPSLRANSGSTYPQEPVIGKTTSFQDYLGPIDSFRKKQGVDSMPLTKELPLLAPLLEICPQELSASARKQLALGVALALNKPSLLVLHDPLETLSLDLIAHVLLRLRCLVDGGSLILCVMNTSASARLLTSSLHGLTPLMAKTLREES